MRLIFHGELEKLYGREAAMEAATVADAIEGFSRQQSDWPREMAISAVGFDTPEKLATSSKEVHLIPVMRGGGGKFTQIIIGAAMIVVGVILLPSPVGWSLIISGAVMVLSGVMQLFMKTPSTKSVNDPAASKYLSVNRNTTAQNTPITLAWGRVNLAPHWLSLQSDSVNLSTGVFPATP